MRHIVDFKISAEDEEIIALSNDGILFLFSAPDEVKGKKDRELTLADFQWLPLPALPQEFYDESKTMAAEAARAREAYSGHNIADVMAQFREAMGSLYPGVTLTGGATVGEPHPDDPRCTVPVDQEGDEPVVCGQVAVLLDKDTLAPRCARHAGWEKTTQPDLKPVP